MAQLGQPHIVIKRSDLKPKPEPSDRELLADAARQTALWLKTRQKPTPQR